MDDFERAISTFETVETVEPLKEGTLLIYNKLKNSLTQKGLQVTEALGLPFDTDFHEAIAHVPSPSEDLKNKIIDVTQKGYALNGKVIRFAKVVVGA
jgi:molecular chaperone GrpE